MSLTETSRYIALILRHKPETIDIKLDSHGWASVEDLIRGVSKTHPLIEVRQIWPVLYWSNCGQNFLQNKKLCRMMKKRPFSRVLSLKNGLFLVEVRRLELRASWSQTRRSTRWATPRRWKNLWNCSSHRTGQNCGQTTFARVGQTVNARFSSVFLAFPRFFEDGIG